MKAHLAITAILLSSIAIPLIAFADSLDDSFNELGTTICKRSIDEKAKQPAFKSLKTKGSKLEPICLLAVKTALGQCLDNTTNFYKKFTTSKERERVSRMLKTGMMFCASYADIPATEIINLVLEEAVHNKTSVDEAVVKVTDEASKSNK